MSLASQTQRNLQIGDTRCSYYSLEELEDTAKLCPEGTIKRLPFTIRIMLENVLRNNASGIATPADVEAVLSWLKNRKGEAAVPYLPTRVVLQDLTGVPVMTDLAAMREAYSAAGGDPQDINPVTPTDLVVDHSVQVDHYASGDALRLNVEFEYERNRERYEFLRWSQGAFSNVRVVPPGTGIVHQVNLEHLTQVITRAKGGELYPDTCAGADSHTTMVNGLGVLAWGVGGIEAESVMLGQPTFMTPPSVIGVRLSGALGNGITATDLVLTLTSKLREYGVVGKFVEFFGPGLASMPVTDRATIGNMAPEYGATCGYFPIDERAIEYLRRTGRDDEHVERVERYAHSNHLWYSAQCEPEYTDVIEFDLSAVETSLAGPRRPQDLVPLQGVPRNFTENFPAQQQGGANGAVPHGAVAIAAITSCTNTSNPSVMVGAGLLARKAVERGLKRNEWVKSSLAPGSKVVTKYLDQAGLSSYLDQLGFNTVGYGCTTCIGNSGPVAEQVRSTLDENAGTVVAAVLSGNRNFEGRIHPLVKASYIASPMLVVAYALAGRIGVDFESEPVGQDGNGQPVYLRDIWPSQDEIFKTMAEAIKPEMFQEQYRSVYEGTAEWRKLKEGGAETYEWSDDSTYIKMPPFLNMNGHDRSSNVVGARVLVMVGDSITTDHISPAGSIQPASPAGQYLRKLGIKRAGFNSFGSRRGNHEVMVRGTFGNIRLRNQLVPEREGDWTVYFPEESEMHIFEAAERYREDHTPLIVLAGKNYGAGSSRDWAAKGPVLLGVRVVIAESYERIHQSNLVGMGILPLQYAEGQNAASLGLTGSETFKISGLSDGLSTNMEVTVSPVAADGTALPSFKTVARLDNRFEVEYYSGGGVLPWVVRSMLKRNA